MLGLADSRLATPGNHLIHGCPITRTIFPIMTKAEFYAVIEEIVEQAPGTVQGNELLADLEGWDSLGWVAFIAAMDKRLGMAVPSKGLVEATSVADLLALVADRLTE